MRTPTTDPLSANATREASSPATLSQSHFGGGGRAAPPRPGSAGKPPDGSDRPRKGRGRPRRKPLKRASDAMRKVVAGTLLLAAAIILMDTVRTFVTHHPLSAAAAMAVVSGVLLPVIIVEIMITVDTSGGNGLRVLQALIVIGVISSVREILMITARLSFDSNGTAANPHAALMLGANTAVVLGLTVAFVLIRLFAGPRSKVRA